MQELCKLENVTADGEVCGDVALFDGKLIPINWREIRLDQYFCGDCGDYFSPDELLKHLELENRND